MEGCAIQPRREMPVAYSRVDISSWYSIPFWHSIPNSPTPRTRRRAWDRVQRGEVFFYFLYAILDRLSYLIFLRRLRYMYSDTHRDEKQKGRDKISRESRTGKYIIGRSVRISIAERVPSSKVAVVIQYSLYFHRSTTHRSFLLSCKSFQSFKKADNGNILICKYIIMQYYNRIIY